jgi:RHS repeat-associated protein
MSLTPDTGTDKVVTLTDTNGAQVEFTKYTPASAKPWCTGVTNYCADAPRIISTLQRGSSGTWTLVRTANGVQSTFVFSSTGVLNTIEDAQAQTLHRSDYSPLSGQAPCPASHTCVAWKSSATGRELVLSTTSSSGRFSAVYDPTSAPTYTDARKATFSYTGPTCSAFASSQPADLCRAANPGEPASVYTYAPTNATTAFRYDLMTMTAPGTDGDTTNTYDTQGRIVRQKDPDGEVTTFTYTGSNASTQGGQTTVTMFPTGTGPTRPKNVDVYTFSDNVLVGKVIGSGTADYLATTILPNPASLKPQITVNRLGEAHSSQFETYGSNGSQTSSADVTTSTDALGNTTHASYNSRNQVWCTVAAAEVTHGVTCPPSEPTSPPAPGAQDPDPGATISYFAATGDLVAQMNPLGAVTTYAYTGAATGVPPGLQYCSVDPVDYAKSISCPAYGHAHVTGTSTTTYDTEGDVIATTDATGATTTTCYFYETTGCAKGAPPGADGKNPDLVYSTTDPSGTVTTYTYDTAGHVIKSVKSFGSYTATTVTAYTARGLEYCSIAPQAYAKGHTLCPSTPPTAPPAVNTTDPWPGMTITIHDQDGRTIDSVNPLGGVSETAYDKVGAVYCTVGPTAYAKGTTCPTLPLTTPTQGHDPYLGATITQYNALGEVVQVTDPLGDITLTSYDGAGNVIETVKESTTPTVAPNVVTSNSYNADNEMISTTTGTGANASTTKTAYTPTGHTYCTVAANPVAKGTSSYHCPEWNPTWVAVPPSPVGLYVTSAPTAFEAQAVSLSFHNATGATTESFNALGEATVTAYDQDTRSYCTIDPVNLDTWLAANKSKTYPYSCPAPTAAVPAAGSDPGYDLVTYNQTGKTLTSTNQLGDTTTTAYDAFGDPVTVTNATGDVTTTCYYYEYDAGSCKVFTPPKSIDSTSPNTTPRSIRAISCPSTATCMAVDSSGHAVMETSGSWSAPVDVDSSRTLTSISCPSTSMCMAVDSSGFAVEWSANAWSTPVKVLPSTTNLFINAFTSISCVSSTTCTLVDGVGEVFKWNGSNWSHQKTLSTATWMTSVSCINSPAYVCEAVNTKGESFYYSTGSWGPAHTYGYGSSSSLNAVSCFALAASGTLYPACVAVGKGGEEAADLANFLFGTETVDATHTLVAVSCASNKGATKPVCDMTDTAGRVVNLDSTGHSPPSILGTGDDFGAISCPTIISCTAAATVGAVVTTRSGAGTASAVWSTESPPTQTNPTGVVTTTSYGPGGAVASTTTPAGVTHDSYNTAGDKIATSYTTTAPGFSQPHTVAWTYTQGGTRASMTDGTGTTTYGHDAAGDVVSQDFTPASGTGLVAQTLSFAYADAGQRSRVTYPSYGTMTDPTSTYKFNTDGEMSSVSDWSGHTISFTYDHDGNVTSQNNPGNANMFAYNSNNQMIQAIDGFSGSQTGISPQVVSGGSTLSGTGVLTTPKTALGGSSSSRLSTSTVTLNTMKNYFTPPGSGSITQDAVPSKGEPKPPNTPNLPKSNATPSPSTSPGSATATTTAVVTSDGSTPKSTSLLPPLTPGASHSITLDATTSCGSKYQLVTDFSTSSTLPLKNKSGTAPAQGARNATGQLTQFDQNLYANCQYTGASFANERNYTYDASGQVVYQGKAPTGLKCLHPSGPTLGCFSYAPDQSPTEMSNTDAYGQFNTYTDTFTKSGEMLSETPIAESDGAPYTFGYDALGDLTSSSSGTFHLEYGYDQLGQMTSYKFFTTTTYQYNGDGLEAATTVGSNTSQYLWATRTGSSDIYSDGRDYFIYGPSGTPVEQFNVTTSPPTANPTFLTYIAPADDWFVSSGTGTLTNATGYDAYGNLSNGTPGTAFGFAGQFTDDTSSNPTGFVNMRARFYDTQAGQFTSVDPMLAETHEPYAYATDDPVNESDPTGMYSYSYAWDLGEVGTPLAVFTYFSTHMQKVFPFSTGGCERFYLGERCDFHPKFGPITTDDHLHVSYLTKDSVTLVVTTWCQSGKVFGVCLAGDPEGSTIHFFVIPYHTTSVDLGSCNSNGIVDALVQEATASGAGLFTDRLAPGVAAGVWHQQARNLERALGGTPNSVKEISALSSGPTYFGYH